MSVAAHEARHGAAAMLLGLEVTEARADSPSPDMEGRVLLSLDEDRLREHALVTLVGRLGDEPDWPPSWPLKTARTTDERHLAEYAEEVGLNASGWAGVCAEAERLAGTPGFERIKSTLELLLAGGCVLNEQALKQVHQIAGGEARVQHKTVEASARVTTDLGEFTALAATYGVDRVREQIINGAFAKTIAAWQGSGKMIPLHWNHSGEARNIIGSIDPASMRETGEGLFVRGKLDLQNSDAAREAWRSMKANAVALSFGYSVTDEKRRRDGINELREIDLFEVSIAPHPVNPDTRILSTKSATRTEAPSDAELRDRARALGLPILPTRAERQATAIKAETDAIRAQARDEMLNILTSVEQRLERRQTWELRRAADRLQLTVALGYDPWDR